MRARPLRTEPGSSVIIRLIPCILLLAFWLAGTPALAAAGAAASRQEVELFVAAGCPHCAAAEAFMDELARERPGLRVTVVDVRRSPEALGRLAALSERAGIARPGVPSSRIGDQLIVGFDKAETTGRRIRDALDGATAAARADGADSCAIAAATPCQTAAAETIGLPGIDQRLSVDDLGLPLFTVLIGLLDGFNPCSMWVLILMISMLATLGDRRRMLAVAGTFVAVEGVAYFAFMAAWLNLFLLVGLSRASEVVIALLALVAGGINLKDFIAPGRGITLSIPAAAKPSIYARLRAILRATGLWPTLVATAMLAILVQVVELLCTSGFPALYTRILTLHPLSGAAYYGYLLLYDLCYMLDDIVVLAIGVATLSQRRLQAREGRILKFAAGVVMLGLGIYLLMPRQ